MAGEVDRRCWQCGNTWHSGEVPVPVCVSCGSGQALHTLARSEDVVAETALAWVLDTMERLDPQSLVFVLLSVGALTKALLLREPREETRELVEAIDVYLRARGVPLPF